MHHRCRLGQPLQDAHQILSIWVLRHGSQGVVRPYGCRLNGALVDLSPQISHQIHKVGCLSAHSQGIVTSGMCFDCVCTANQQSKGALRATAMLYCWPTVMRVLVGAFQLQQALRRVQAELHVPSAVRRLPDCLVRRQVQLHQLAMSQHHTMI